MSNPRFDIVIFGGTGFVGKYAIENLISTIDQDEHELTWAVAGRDLDKIKQTLKSISDKISRDLTNVDIIVADIGDHDSIVNMTSQARVVVNCVGPYARWAPIVIESCLQTATHHIDCSAESQFLEGSYVTYDDIAKKSNILIIGGCAFESLPMEMAVCFMREHFENQNWTLNAIDCYMRIIVGQDGFKLNHGTWDSMVEAIGKPRTFFKVKNQLYKSFFKVKVPKYKHNSSHGYLPFKTSVTKGINVKIYDIDIETSKRTNTHLYQEFNERPVFVAKFMTFHSWKPLLTMITAAMISLPFLFWPLTRKHLLIKHLNLFSLGHFSKTGPTESQINGTSFEYILKASGWSKILGHDVSQQPIEKPDVQIYGSVHGPEMTYPATSQCAIQSAVTIIRERNAIDFAGGVFTPGVIFRNTTLVQRLATRVKNPIVIQLIETTNKTTNLEQVKTTTPV